MIVNCFVCVCIYIYTSLTPSLFIEVPVLSQESERSCIYVLGISNLPISTIFLLNFGTVPTVWYFLIGCEKTSMMMYRLLLLTAELKLQSLKKYGSGPSSVIKIVKMKYNRIDIPNGDLFQPHLKYTLKFFHPC